MLKTGDVIKKDENGNIVIDMSDNNNDSYVVTEYIDGTIMIKPEKKYD